MRTAHAGTVTGLLASATLLAACARTPQQITNPADASPYNVFWYNAELSER